MKTIEEMLEIWHGSSSIMHISHHKAAARYAKWHRWFGSAVSGLSALVASSVFIALLEGNNKTLFIIAALISLLTAILTGVNTSLNLSGKSEAHHQAAILFQGLRREIEEELVNCRNGKIRDSYKHIRKRWTSALDSTPPLPDDIHDKTERETISSLKKTL